MNSLYNNDDSLFRTLFLKCRTEMESQTKKVVDECSICLEGLRDPIYETACRHKFHRRCIKASLQFQKRGAERCPNCREAVSKTDKKELGEFCVSCLERFTFRSDDMCNPCGKKIDDFENILKLCCRSDYEQFGHLPIETWIADVPYEDKEETLTSILTLYALLLVNCTCYFEYHDIDSDEVVSHQESVFFLFELGNREFAEDDEEMENVASFVLDDLENDLASLTHRYSTYHQYQKFADDYAKLLSKIYILPIGGKTCRCVVDDLDRLKKCIKKYESEWIRNSVIQCLDNSEERRSFAKCDRLRNLRKEYENVKQEVTFEDLNDRLVRLKYKVELLGRNDDAFEIQTEPLDLSKRFKKNE